MDQESWKHLSARQIAGCLALLAVTCGIVAYAHSRSSKHVSARQDVLYYVDPMHPAYKSDRPGIAPDCGMDLVPVFAKDAGPALILAQPSRPVDVALDPDSRQLYGITLASVEESSGQHIVRAFGRVAPDETRVYRLNVSTAGFVKDTHDDAVGTRVRKDQKLATIYSSELLYAVQGYISGSLRIPSPGMRDAAGSPEAQNAQSRLDYLRNLGMSAGQIEELQKTRKIPDNLYIESPVDGVVVSRTASPGLRFEKNTELYSVVDLSHVWVLADVFGNDALAFRPGTEARVTLQDTGETFHARVSTVLPEIDPSTRTLKARLELDNPNLRLRPDMFVTVQLAARPQPGLTVPADAILDSGLAERVFVQTSPSHFKPQEVQTGWRSGDRVQILKGLSTGQVIVASGTFLVDSESRLQASSQAAVKHDRQSSQPLTLESPQ